MEEKTPTLFDLLIKNLPSFVAAGNRKRTPNSEKNRHRPAALALDKFRYISFNSKERISFLVFDLDYIEGEKANEVMPLQECVHYIYGMLGLVPTYTCKTAKGYQFAFHLKNHVFTKQTKVMKYAQDIKKAVTKILGCDVNASHRLHGIWRNPIQHEHWYSREMDFELNDFKETVKLYNRLSNDALKSPTWRHFSPFKV